MEYLEYEYQAHIVVSDAEEDPSHDTGVTLLRGNVQDKHNCMYMQYMSIFEVTVKIRLKFRDRNYDIMDAIGDAANKLKMYMCSANGT